MPYAVNPTTGERLELVNGQWVPAGNAAATPVAAAPAGPVTIGTPKPKEPNIRQIGDQLGVVGSDGSFTPTYTAPPKPDKADKTPGDIDASAKARVDALTQYNAAKQMRDRLAEMRRKFMAGPGSTTGLAGVRDWLPGPAQQEFDSAASAVRGQVGTLLGFTGGQLNAVREAELAVGPYIPTSKDFDQTARDKMARLEALAAEAEARSIAVLGGRPDANGNIEPIDGTTNTLAPQGATRPEGGGSPGGGDNSSNVSALSEEQQRAYQAFVQANGGKPAPAQLQMFLEALTGKPVKNADEIAAALAKGSPINTAVEDLTPRQTVDAENELGLGDSAVTTMVKQGGMLGLSDEAAGVGNAAAGLLTGNLDLGSRYRTGRDAERLRIADARTQLGWGGAALEVAGGFVSANPVGVLAPLVGGTRALVAQGARSGAAGGALAGYGYGEGLEGSATGAMIGGAAGGALGGGISALSARYAPRGMAPDLAAAADAENVSLIRPMVDPASRGRMGALESNPSGQPVIRQGIERVEGEIEAGVQRLGQGGQALEPGAAGDRIQVAGNRYIARSRGIAGRLYDRAQRLAGGTQITPTNAVARVDTEIAELSALPNVNQGEIAFLQELREDLTRGPLDVATLRNLRTSLRGRIGTQNLTMTQAEARAARVLDAAADDITASVPPAASNAFRRADAFYRERQVMVDDIKKAVLGRRDAPMDSQQTFAKLKSAASPGGDGRRLAATMRILEPDERQDVAATIAHSLGRRDVDAPFSPALFLSQSTKLSPSARRTIFGPDGAQSIDNLRQLSRALVEAQSDVNRPRTSGSMIRNRAYQFLTALTGLGGAGLGAGSELAVGAAAVGFGAMGATAGRSYLSARALVNPRVSRWLAESANVNTPTQAQQAVRRLGTVISREPALAAELRPIHEMLTRNLSRPSAASETGAEQGGQADD